MSLCDCRGLFANDKEMARRRSGAASRDSDEVIHKKHRQACGRINQRFLKFFLKFSANSAITCVNNPFGLISEIPVSSILSRLSSKAHTF